MGNGVAAGATRAVQFVRVFADREGGNVDRIQTAGGPVVVLEPGEENEVEVRALPALIASGGDWRWRLREVGG